MSPYCALRRWAFEERWIIFTPAQQFLSIRPITIGPLGSYFILFSCPLHPKGPSAFRTKEPWGDDLKVKGVTDIFYDGMRPIKQKGGFKVMVTMG